MNKYNPNRLVELAKQKSILDVAGMLGMQLKRVGRNYQWTEHPSFKINPDKNYFSWFSRGNEYLGKDVIEMVKVVNNVSFKEALHFLLEAEVGTFDITKVPKPKPFVYKVKETKTFDYARKYLKEERGLSDETINFFLEKGVMVQAIHTDYETGQTEPMIVFKHLDVEGKVIGGARQGIWYNKELYPDTNGRLKRTLPRSKGGFVVDIGNKEQFKKATPENPFTVIAFEAPIDMMSYYEIYKDKLSNCRLVAMNGLNIGVVSRAIVDALCTSPEEMKAIFEKVRLEEWLQEINDLCEKNEQVFEKLRIVLAVDNDEPKFDVKSGKIITPGKDFYEGLKLKNIPIIPHMPKCHEGQKKNDWNDELKIRKGLLKVKAQERTLQNMITKIKMSQPAVETQTMEL